MSLFRSLLLGVALGGVVATGVYSAVASPPRAAVPVPATFAPVPTPTRTVLADCEPPAKLVKGACVTTVPGPVVVVAAGPAGGAAGSATGPGSTLGTAEAEDRDDHEDEDHEDHGDEDDGDRDDHEDGEDADD